MIEALLHRPGSDEAEIGGMLVAHYGNALVALSKNFSNFLKGLSGR